MHIFNKVEKINTKGEIKDTKTNFVEIFTSKFNIFVIDARCSKKKLVFSQFYVRNNNNKR